MPQIYLFGDQTIHADSSLQELLYFSNNKTVSILLSEAYQAIRKEISCLPATERALFPQPETLGLLLDAVKKGKRHPALESALLCLYEIAEYIRVQEIGHVDPSDANQFLIGLCTGSLAAAAISCSRTVAELIPLGIESVVVAFWVGMNAFRKANVLAPSSPASPKSWSLTVAGITEIECEKAIQSCCDDSERPITMKPYISAVGSHSVTISGPSHVIEALQSFSVLKEKRTLLLPIYAPYHASHLYIENDVTEILSSISRSLSVDRVPQIPIISNASGLVLIESTFGALLHTLVKEILTNPVRIDHIIDGIAENTLGGTRHLIPIHTQSGSSIASALRQRGLEVICTTHPSAKTDSVRTEHNSSNQDSSKIAIIGFSGRFPEADNLDEFWKVLEEGLDVHKPIPSDRFDREAHYDPTLQRKNTSRIRHGCWIRNPGLFDARFFHFSPREACQADPAQRLALLTAYEAIEMAGLVPDRTPSTQRRRVGVYYGTTSDDWREVNSGQNIDTYFIPGGNRAFVPGRLNYFFKFGGPSVSVDTACSSSLAAINVACTALLNQECDTALAGGTNVMTNPDNFAGLDRGHFLSPSGNCKTFDDGADGYCRADGVGSVVLKRLSDAIADNDPIFGVIRGTHTSHSAEAVSITRPLADAQEYLFRQILSRTGIHPHEISYIEMHGTGTQAGDAVEMKSVLDTFAWDKSRPPNMPLHLGSVKSNVGHGESASGVTALIKVLLMFQRNRIPPHCGIKTKINHSFPTDLNERNVHIALSEADWSRPKNSTRRTFVNNFSAAGGNTAILLEDAATVDRNEQQDPRIHHVVTVSARSEKSLRRNLQSLAKFIDSKTCPGLLAQISYTTTARRMHHSRRVAVSGSDLSHIKRRLLELASEEIRSIPAKSPCVGFLLTGQGAQQTAMAQQLYQHITSFRADIHSFDAISHAHGLPSCLPLVTGSIEIENLSPTTIQLGTVIVQMALGRLWRNWGLLPQYVLGHSLGEFAALELAGVLSVSDTIYLTASRALLLEKACTSGSHGMMAVKSSPADLRDVLEELPVEIACINGPQDTVLSGSGSDIDKASQRLSQNGLRSTKLILPFAFHSSQVNPILDDLEEIAGRLVFNEPKIPFISTLLGEVVTEEGIIGPHYIRRHCRETVNFFQAVEAAKAIGLVDIKGLGIEIGAHPILTGMMTKVMGSEFRSCPSLRRNEDAFKTLAESLSVLHVAGVPINWNEYHRDFAMSQKALTLPSYSWDLENYWIQYENNFCLTKGSPQVEDPLEIPAPTSTRISPSVQKIVEEQINDRNAHIVIESDFHDPELLPVALGHKLNGLVLCPSSLYADIAYTLGKYIAEKKGYGEGFTPDVADVIVEKALVIKDSGPQSFRASLDFDWSSHRGRMEVFSVDISGKRTISHAHCTVYLQESNIWKDSWRRQQYLIQRSIEVLEKGVNTGSAHKLHRGLVYKLFSSTVQYDYSYQGIEEITFDSTGLEATAKVCLKPSQYKYKLNPFWCDSFGHLTGFVMNSNDSLDLSKDTFINHGWAFMRCSETLSADHVYQTYVKMQPVGDNDNLFSGDVYVLRDKNIVAQYGSVTFQRIANRVLEILLPAPKPKPLATRAAPETTPLSLANSKSTPSPKEKPSGASDLWKQVLKVIADEIAIAPEQLTNDVEFTDMGVDSLMSLTILGTLRESFHLDVPLSLFEDCPSVQSLSDYLGLSSSGVSSDAPSIKSSENDTGASTPLTGPMENTAFDTIDASVTMILSILAEEIGLGAKELAKVEDFAEVGVDSLLSLLALGRLREEMGLDLPPDFFMESTNAAAVKNSLKTIYGVTENVSIDPSPRTTVALSTTSHPPATSILLQGRSSCPQTLFLFPDGSGSSTSYAMLPNISPDVRVYGLNCPYMQKPEDLKCALQDLTPSYVAEIRRRQPSGPYNLAGWSAGGIAAYDAAQYLIQQGEAVPRLILLDSPNPIGLDKLPPRFYHFLEKAGVFGSHGGKKPPPWLIRHFLAFIEALDKWRPIPFKPAHAAPRTTLIWARDGVCKLASDPRPELQDDDPKEMTWLLENRTDLGPNGWDKLLGHGIKIESVANANHFTMVREPAATSLSAIIRHAMLS
ncbi:Type I Polyketide synthases (Type I PKS) [Penicillium verhagenii]|uniref:Type I Polyketide synthases (Type I PKS) n=1 Tax=Penicillium verhagenii TaxID=1562060 RepID=UPI00254534A9|nr:Type I Polyketide synthases (Type I PKS) [Penicillium verhagenii]KAJ5947462.1 Type I Polyketide synthases (Type I PKS) [Penicillium verhagenii]